MDDAAVAAFERDGFVAVPDVLSASDLATLRAAADDPALLPGRKAIGGSGHQFDVASINHAFRDLAEHSGVLDCVARLIGDDVQVQHIKLATKPLETGQGEVAWHQDFAFVPHTNTDLVAAFVYLDDATVENGCMAFVPGSHRLGPLSHYDEAAGEFTSTCQESARALALAEPVALPVRAGGISLHHCLVLHSSYPNVSARPRRGAVVQYRAADAMQLGGPVFDDTGRQVRGEFREHVRCVEQAVRIPRMPATVLRGGYPAGQGGLGVYDLTRGATALPESANGARPRRALWRRHG
jgi:phytanoyl-CoA hydroxylase